MQTLSYFDINGRFGSGAYEKAEYPTARDLLAQMDYLGIDRALVWHILARDLAPVAGNRILSETILASEEARRRLVPAQVVTPSNAYEYGAVAHIRAMAGRHSSAALRIFPKTSRFNIAALDRLFKELRDMEPVVFWDMKDDNGYTDTLGLRTLAEAFPGFKFVLTELMWMQFNDAVDLMQRCSSVHIDISWLHMRGAIELLTEQFGPERILFGTGFKSHYGAAIAALNHAEISDEARALIAGGNAQRLLKLGPLERPAARPPDILREKPIWQQFRAGLAVKNREIIDIHTHTVPFTRGWIIRDIELKDYVPNLIRQMARLGVSRAVMIPEQALFGDTPVGNREVEQILAPYSNRLSGYLVYNPLYGDALLTELDNFFARGFFIGFKILPAYWRRPLSDAGYRPVWEYANRHCRPILIHAWDDRWNSPAMLESIAPAYPDATFILGHSGGGTRGRAEAVDLCRKNPNVLLEFCGSFTTPVDWLDTFAKAGMDRVAFGSDTGGHNQAWELGRLLSIPLPDDVLAPVLADNFRRLVNRKRAIFK